MKLSNSRKEARSRGVAKRCLAILCLAALILSGLPRTMLLADGPDLSCDAAVLMEGSTGEILYEKNATKELRPASITKIMTLLLIFEAIDEGRISLTDDVSVSEHAASMGGSQVYLEPYETQKVETMIKCISIASANDASVAMAEFIAGSEEEFVSRMNARAKELGMEHTKFVNCYGLDTDGHYSCALDVALMSRELIMKHPEISNYSTVWMDTFVHTTSRGQTEFGLTNTNKLIKSYQGITGLKTGSTGLAKYCLSATARRDGMNLIAVIMAAPDTKTRFKEAAELLNYGFANYSLYTYDFTGTVFDPVAVKQGTDKTVNVRAEENFSYLCASGIQGSNIQMLPEYETELIAPLEEGAVAGRAVFWYDGKEIGSVRLLTVSAVEKEKYLDSLKEAWKKYFGG